GHVYPKSLMRGAACSSNYTRAMGPRLARFRPGALRKGFLAIARNQFVIAGVVADLFHSSRLWPCYQWRSSASRWSATAAIFVVETAGAKVLLGESVTWKRWVGVAFIVAESGYSACKHAIAQQRR